MLKSKNFTPPDLKKFISLNESMSSIFGTYPESKVVGIADNTKTFSMMESEKYIAGLEEKLQLPVTDPIRFGMEKLAKAIEVS